MTNEKIAAAARGMTVVLYRQIDAITEIDISAVQTVIEAELTRHFAGERATEADMLQLLRSVWLEGFDSETATYQDSPTIDDVMGAVFNPATKSDTSGEDVAAGDKPKIEDLCQQHDMGKEFAKCTCKPDDTKIGLTEKESTTRA